MKNLLHFIFTLLSISFYAQEPPSYIEVTYEMVMDLDPETVINNIPSKYRAGIEDQIRQEIADGIKMNYVLKTNGNESTYQLVERISNAQSPAGMITQQFMSQDKGVFYKDLTTKTFLKPYDVAGNQYLINDKLPDYTWTVSREKEEIAGFDTRKAQGQYNDTIMVNAWYAPKLSLKDGPDRTWGLPGLILKSEFETNGIDITITATSVAVKDEEITIEKPTNGKQMTQDEFEAEMLRITQMYKDMMSEGVDTE